MLPSLLLKTKGPPYLSASSLSSIIRSFREFFRNNFKYIYAEIGDSEFDGSFDEVVSPDTKKSLEMALKRSEILSPNSEDFVFPLTPVEVEQNFDCDQFFIKDSHSIVEDDAEQLIEHHLRSGQVNAWLGLSSPSREMALKTRRIVLGAIALVFLRRDRHMFTLGKTARNYLKLGKTQVVSYSSNSHTPPIGTRDKITCQDFGWLNKISAILVSKTAADKRNCKALEYYYRAWFMDGNDRCPFLFMTLDAIFGQGQGKTGEKIQAGIKSTISDLIDSKRLSDLLLIRNQILHGGAPDVFASTRYVKYCKMYETDPVGDLDLLTERCLRAHIFGSNFRVQDDPYEQDIAKWRKMGILPYTISENMIVSDSV